MPKKATDNLYLNYDDYTFVSKKFGRDRKYSYSFVNVDEVLNLANIVDPEKSKYMDAFHELLRHIHNSHVMYSHTKPGCMYISYMLHKEVTNHLKLEYDFDVFKIFHLFVLKYYKHRGMGSQLCLQNFAYIDPDMYTKMDALYRLYNLCDEFLSSKSHQNTSSCIPLKILVLQYNEYLQKYKSNNTYFNKILEDLGKKISKAIEEHEHKCPDTSFKLSTIVPDIPPIEKQPVIKKSEEHPPNTPNLVTGISQPEATNHGDISNDNRGTQIKLTPPLSVAIEVKGTDQEAEQRHDSITIQESVSINPSPYLQTTRQPEVLEILELTEQQENLGRSSYFIPTLSEKEDEGILGKMKSAISGIGEYVEPVPLMGVSGGMGALFLLLRYTPVGTFFRGGRGRAHRIPRSFHGHFPGAFPDYHEYDGGYIGYGPMNINPLAE